MIIRVLIAIGLFLPFSLYGQEEGTPTRSAIKLDFKLPSGLTNHSFRNMMSGLADVDLNYTYHFEDIHLIAGAGIKYSYWNLESANFPNDIVTGRLEVVSPFINLGYRSIMGEKTFLDIELNGGYGRLFTSSNQNDKAYVQDAMILSPKLSFYLQASNLLYFGINGGYTLMGAEFTPSNLYLENFPAANDSYNQGKYQYFSVGFGFYAIIPTFK
ncbi:hypothetical protein [Parvicella tangerina]|uniref:Outer membrane protein beta-barrel domain-containing protein n=1 Tax=Parvicella tangerina TaxID=2829795 RepID=A0A916JJE9_9FLAO|nr:hypothetical protein [Parvicella tangerina]CAG5076857.1 hypothetical protein CRYO30217_00223 [Parvicella tangerina]